MSEAAATSAELDPRVRRTRKMLQDGLARLLGDKEFDQISVQEIADASGLHRATFYDHYPDKPALLECMVASRFLELLNDRGVRYESCGGALRAIARAVCDYIATTPNRPGGGYRRLESYMERAVIAVVRKMILDGLKKHPGGGMPVELIAATASWAIFGAAKEWLERQDRTPVEEIVSQIEVLVSPVFLSAENVAG